MNQAPRARRFGAKIYLDSDQQQLDLARQIGVFQRWIQQSALDELMIDVADYRHVPGGPGVMLICHAAHYALDSTDGKPGLTFDAKREEPAGLAARLKRAFTSVLRAAQLLEREGNGSGLRFDTRAMQLRVQDRLLAPNEPQTFDALEPALRRTAETLYAGLAVQLEPSGGDNRQAFSVMLTSAATPPDLDTLSARAEQLPS